MFHLFLPIVCLQQTARSLSGFDTDAAAHVLQDPPTTVEFIRIVCITGCERGYVGLPGAKLEPWASGLLRQHLGSGLGFGLTDFSGSPLKSK